MRKIAQIVAAIVAAGLLAATTFAQSTVTFKGDHVVGGSVAVQPPAPPPPPPPVPSCTLTATPDTVDLGDAVVLTWVALNTVGVDGSLLGVPLGVLLLPTDSFIVTPTVSSVYTLKVTGLGGDTSTCSANVTVTSPSPFLSIWPQDTVPAKPANTDDGRAVTVGVKWYSDVIGYVTGIQFYKAPSNTGVHLGQLWTASGFQLGSAAFTAETASGWQQATLDTPVGVCPNTHYVASYYAPNGQYAQDLGYFATARDTAPLHALADGVDGPDGVYNYDYVFKSAGPWFPTDSHLQTNYYVDVLFVPDPTAVGIISASPVSGAVGTPVTITGCGFDSTAVVSFSGVPAVTTFVSPTSLTAIAPDHPLGAVDITVSMSSAQARLPN